MGKGEFGSAAKARRRREEKLERQEEEAQERKQIIHNTIKKLKNNITSIWIINNINLTDRQYSELILKYEEILSAITCHVEGVKMITYKTICRDSKIIQVQLYFYIEGSKPIPPISPPEIICLAPPLRDVTDLICPCTIL